MVKEKYKKDGSISHQGEFGGQPRKFEIPEELEEYINNFFNWCEEQGKRPTVTRLAVYLDTNRQTLINYENADCFIDRFVSCNEVDKKKYVDAIKRVKAKIESEYEDSLFNSGEYKGAKFSLANNYNWKDKQEVITTNNSIEVTLED